MKSKYIQAITFCSLLAISGSINAQLSPLTIGTINAGDSVVIYYDVTINTGAGSQVSNQGTVSGSNFVSFVTNDPDTGPVNDATVTALNMFPLPVTIYSISAAPKNNGLEVAWNVAAESNMLKYEVERSTDGRTFITLGEVVAQNSGQAARYVFLDATAGSGTTYYRLKLVERSGAGKYSTVVKVDLAGKAGNITVFPNPAQQKQITLQLNNMGKGTYQLQIYNSAGQPVYSKSVLHEGGSLSRGITLPSALASGTYFVKFQNEKAVYSQSLLVK